MTGIFAKLPYRAQLKRSESPLTDEIDRAFEAAARNFGARMHVEGECYLLSFADDARCVTLRAVEALRTIGLVFDGLAPRLHGWFLAIGGCDTSPSEVMAAYTREWLHVFSDGIYATPEIASTHAGYLECGPGNNLFPVTAFPAAGPALPEGYSRPDPDEAALDRMLREIDRHARGISGALVLNAVGAGDSAFHLVMTALERLYGRDWAPLILRPGSWPSPLGTFLAAFPPARESADDRSEGLRAARFLFESPYRLRHPPSIGRAFRDYVATKLLEFAESGTEDRPSIVLLDGIDGFTAESIALLRAILAPPSKQRGSRAERASTGSRRKLPLFIATSGTLPPDLEGVKTRSLSAPPPGPAAIAEAARRGAESIGKPGLAPLLAGSARGDSFRLGLAMRLASRDRLENGGADLIELAEAALRTWPPEFSAFLRAISLSEEALDDAALDDFLGSAGFVPGIRPLISRELVAAGFLSGTLRLRIARPEAAVCARRESEVSADIDRIFTAELLKLHGSKRLIPSLAFWHRLATVEGSKRDRGVFLLDCLASEAVFGPSESDSAPAPDAPLARFLPFLLAQSAADEKRSRETLEALDLAIGTAGNNPLESAIAALAHACDDFARGPAQAATSRLRPALMSLHDLGALRAEARAHRLLGMCSLGQSQVQEGSAYLSNAFELAARVPDHLEGFLAAYAAAGSNMVLGDLRQAEKWLTAAREIAGISFRPDWIFACLFLAGRLAFELGRYGEAEGFFGEARTIAEENDGTDQEEDGNLMGTASTRATAWAGRAAAYADSGSRARELLSSLEGDAEASWFLAELSGWEGAWGEAAALASRSLDLAPRRSYRPADALIWDSGFDSIEGLSLGRGPGSPYLEDQVAVFVAFARALAEGDGSLLASITSRTREKRLAAIHPQAHLYDYYGFIVSESLIDCPVDPGTLLSRAWKALQVRSSRMEEAVLKNQFLEGNRWNREIVAAARARRLI